MTVLWFIKKWHRSWKFQSTRKNRLSCDFASAECSCCGEFLIFIMSDLHLAFVLLSRMVRTEEYETFVNSQHSTFSIESLHLILIYIWNSVFMIYLNDELNRSWTRDFCSLIRSWTDSQWGHRRCVLSPPRSRFVLLQLSFLIFWLRWETTASFALGRRFWPTATIQESWLPMPSMTKWPMPGNQFRISWLTKVSWPSKRRLTEEVLWWTKWKTDFTTGLFIK